MQRDEVEPVRVPAFPQLFGEWLELIVGLGLFTIEEEGVSDYIHLIGGLVVGDIPGSKTYSCPETLEAFHWLLQ